MKNKSFAVIGLGQFGMTLAVTLAESDCDVLAIDDKEENIEEISEKVTYAVKADVREPGILKALGSSERGCGDHCVAENLEASISATMQAKDLGVPFVVAKSMNSLHGRFLIKSVQIKLSTRNSPWGCVWPEIFCPADIWMCLNFLGIQHSRVCHSGILDRKKPRRA